MRESTTRRREKRKETSVLLRKLYVSIILCSNKWMWTILPLCKQCTEKMAKNRKQWLERNWQNGNGRKNERTRKMSLGQHTHTQTQTIVARDREKIPVENIFEYKQLKKKPLSNWSTQLESVRDNFIYYPFSIWSQCFGYQWRRGETDLVHVCCCCHPNHTRNFICLCYFPF